jgi:hypothetical protein
MMSQFTVHKSGQARKGLRCTTHHDVRLWTPFVSTGPQLPVTCPLQVVAGTI